MHQNNRSLTPHCPVSLFQWADPLHTPHFRQLVQFLLECYLHTGFLDDIPEADIPLIAALSMYHDIGKQWIPDTVLYKQGKLSPTEIEIVKQHPLFGSAYIEAVLGGRNGRPDYVYLYEICRHHHERIDGGGYPDQLCGNSLAPYLQVVGLADAYDALIAQRPYKPRLSSQKAAQIILSGGCGAFDIQLLSCFSANIVHIHHLTYLEVDASV